MSGAIHISHSPAYPVSARYAAFSIRPSDAPPDDIAIAYVLPGSVPEMSGPAILVALVAPDRERIQGIVFDLKDAEHVVLRLMRAICDVKQKLNQEAACGLPDVVEGG